MGDLSIFSFNAFLPHDLPKDCLKQAHYPAIIYCKIQTTDVFIFIIVKESTRTLQLSIATLYEWTNSLMNVL